jgi:hypothetical protein
MSEIDLLEAELLAGAAAALRKRAQRQAQLAAAGTTRGDRGVRTGEAAIASRLADAFSQLAREFEKAILDSESELERPSSHV